MAAITGAVLGSVIPIPGANFALAALGSYIDQQFILPAILPSDDIEGPRLNELRIQSAEEGSPVNYLIGTNNRVAGTIIWVSDIIESKQTNTVGGKGGGQKTVQYSYYVSIAVAVAGRQEITGFTKILAEGKKIWEDSVSPSVASSLLSVNHLGGKNTDIESPNGGPDLSVFRPGQGITIAGFSNGSNNGTFIVLASSYTAGTGTSRVRVKNFSGTDEVAGASVTLSQTLPNFVTADMADITLYSGSLTQDPDPLIESFEGVGNVPGFRGIAYVSIEMLALKSYGNRIPQFNFITDANSGVLSTVFANLLTRAGLSGSDYDTSGLSGLTVDGYSISGPEATSRALQPLMTAFDIVEQPTATGGIKFFQRSDATIIDVDPLDLAAHPEGEDTPMDMQIEPMESINLPSEVNVDYLDPLLNDQKGSQRERRRVYDIDAVQNVNLPLVLSGGAAEAKAIAKRLMWTAVNSRQTVLVQLPFKYSHAQKNDVLRFTRGGITWFLLIHRKDRGENFILQFECTIELKSSLIQSAVAEDPVTNEPNRFFPAPIDLVPYDGPPTIDVPGDIPSNTPTQTVMIMFGVSKKDSSTRTLWGGARILDSEDDLEFYEFSSAVEQSCTGFALTALSAGTPGIWDRVNTVDVEMWNGTLETKTELEVLNGQNRMVLGTEVIGFATAALIGTNQWRLSTLLRGLTDTLDQMGTHAIAEQLIHLNGGGLLFRPVSAAQIGTTRYYKAVPAGGEEADSDSVAVTIGPRSIQPFSPVHLNATRSTTGDDVTLEWIRRSRRICKVLGPYASPLEESVEKYEVDILTTGTSTVLRTIDVESAATVDYTEAMQTADGLTAGASPFDFIVYMMNPTVGRGRASDTYTVPGA